MQIVAVLKRSNISSAGKNEYQFGEENLAPETN